MLSGSIKTTKRTSKVSKVKKEMSRQERPSSKALKERKFRQREKERKRFDGPMRKFLEYKYPNVFQEYTELYNSMNRNHPNVRNLAKTRTFKNFLNIEDQTPPTDILTVAIRETMDEELNGEACQEVESEELNGSVESEEAASRLDSGEAASRLESQIDAIMNQLLNDQDLGNMLGNEVDEGIELNVMDEIEFDIEPFDYELEVEGIDW